MSVAVLDRSMAIGEKSSPVEHSPGTQRLLEGPMAVAIAGGWLVLRLTGSLAWLFAAVALGLLLHGLIVFAAVLSGAWFRGDRLTKNPA